MTRRLGYSESAPLYRKGANMGDVIQFPIKPKTPTVPAEAKVLVLRAYKHLQEAERLMAQANAMADAAGVPKKARRI